MSLTTNNHQPPTTFPAYYRKAGKCIKVMGPTQARVIILPPESMVPERFTSSYPSSERLAEEIAGMNASSEQEFKSFLITFYQGVAAEREILASQKGS